MKLGETAIKTRFGYCVLTGNSWSGKTAPSALNCWAVCREALSLRLLDVVWCDGVSWAKDLG